MAIFSGQDGVMKVGTTSVAELRGFSIDTTTEALQTTTMGDSAHTYINGLENFSGSADVFYDSTHHTSITALTGGSNAGPVTLTFFPAGEGASSNPKLTGSAIITGYSLTSSFDGVIEASITFQGTGDLTYTTNE